MNKRIKELADHCFDYDIDKNELRDYTKLVILECVSVLHQQLSECRFDDRVHLGLGDVRYTIGMEDEYEDMLKEHFGVE